MFGVEAMHSNRGCGADRELPLMTILTSLLLLRLLLVLIKLVEAERRDVGRRTEAGDLSAQVVRLRPGERRVTDHLTSRAVVYFIHLLCICLSFVDLSQCLYD